MDAMTMAVQGGRSWHETGLFMGMHWAWWAFWVVVLLALAQAFLRLFRDRAEMRRSAAREESAEEVLRARFARGEITEEELIHALKVLRETMLGT